MGLVLLDADIVAVLIVDGGTILQDVESGAGEVDDCLYGGGSVFDVKTKVFVLGLHAERLYDVLRALAAALSEHAADGVVG